MGSMDISSLLRPKTFFYLFIVTFFLLLRTNNTLAIIELAKENDKLRQQIQMSSSMIVSQKLKADELHSIHNITQQAIAMGIMPSNAPAIEIDPRENPSR